MSTSNEIQTNLNEADEILLNQVYKQIIKGVPDKIFGVVLNDLPSHNLPLPEVKSRFSSLMTKLKKHSKRFSDESNTWFIHTELNKPDLENALVPFLSNKDQFKVLDNNIPPEIQAWFDGVTYENANSN